MDVNQGRALPTPPPVSPQTLGRKLLGGGSGKKTRSNTTSTVFVTNTPTKPDTDVLIHCLVEELRRQLEANTGYANANDEFDERKYATYPATVTGEIPSKQTLRAFVARVFKEAEVGEEGLRCVSPLWCWRPHTPPVIVMALVYLKRLTSCSDVRLAGTNWKLLVLCCFMLASKVWEEEAVWNEDFLSIFPDIGVKRFAALELHMLTVMKFEVCVKASAYTEAYFELTALSNEKRDWKRKPLTKDQARDLEIRTLNLETKTKEKQGASRRRNSDATHVKSREANVILG